MSYLPPKVLGLTRDEIKALPTQRAPLDLVRIQKRLALGRNNPLRWQHGTFRVPGEATKGQYLLIRDTAIKTFISAYQKRGWELASRIRVEPSRFPSTDLEGHLEQNVQEYVVTAAFKQLNFRPVRIELPPNLFQ